MLTKSVKLYVKQAIQRVKDAVAGLPSYYPRIIHMSELRVFPLSTRSSHMRCPPRWRVPESGEAHLCMGLVMRICGEVGLNLLFSTALETGGFAGEQKQ